MKSVCADALTLHCRGQAGETRAPLPRLQPWLLTHNSSARTCVRFLARRPQVHTPPLTANSQIPPRIYIRTRTVTAAPWKQLTACVGLCATACIRQSEPWTSCSTSVQRFRKKVCYKRTRLSVCASAAVFELLVPNKVHEFSNANLSAMPNSPTTTAALGGGRVLAQQEAVSRQTMLLQIWTRSWPSCYRARPLLLR
jgi:hypothetical protein